MRSLIVGAGATGGYVGAALMAAGRDVTFLVHAGMQAQLAATGLRIRAADGRLITTPVRALVRDELADEHFDLVLLAVRSSVVASALDDVRPVVGAETRILPVVNGMAHLSTLTDAYGADRVIGGTARLATSLGRDGVIDEVQPGVRFEIGPLDGGRTASLADVAAELTVPGVTVSTVDDVVSAMWNKFAFIAATAVFTCLLGDVVGPIVRTPGGTDVARQVLAEVAAVAAAEGHPLTGDVRAGLDAVLTDPSSGFGPSMFRDLRAGRTVETSVLDDLAGRARRHGLATPLLDAALVVLRLAGPR